MREASAIQLLHENALVWATTLACIDWLRRASSLAQLTASRLGPSANFEIDEMVHMRVRAIRGVLL